MTNELSTTAPKAIQQVDDFTPRSVGEALRLAEILSKSTLVPNEYRGNPGNVFVALSMAKELGIPGIQGLQNIAVINGRAGIFGDLGKALLLRAGFKIDEDSIETMRITKRGRCKITRPDGQVMEKNFSMEDAKLGGLLDSTPAWRKTPYDMLGWKAFWRCARGIGSDVLKGMQGAEEIADLPPATSRFDAAKRDAPQLPAPEPPPSADEERGDPDTPQASDELEAGGTAAEPIARLENTRAPNQDASLFAEEQPKKSTYTVHLGIIGACKTFEECDNEAYSITLDKLLTEDEVKKLTKAISIKKQTVKS